MTYPLMNSMFSTPTTLTTPASHLARIFLAVGLATTGLKGQDASSSLSTASDATTPATSSYPWGLLDSLSPGTSKPAATAPLSSSLGTSLGDGASPSGSPAVTSSSKAMETNSLSLSPHTPAILNGRPQDPLAPKRKPESPISFGMRSSVEYNDNVFIDADNEEDDIVAVLAPTLYVNTGDFRKRQAAYLSAAYTATASTYINDTADETLDHWLQAEGQLKKGKLTVPFTAQASRETGAFLDVGGRDTAISYRGRIELNYEATSKVSLGVAAEYSATDYSIFADFSRAIAEAYVSYQVTAKTSLGVAYRYSDSSTDGASSQKYQAALLRLNSSPGTKFSTVSEVGLAFSELGKGDRTDVIYRMGVAYQPTSKRRFALEAVREPNTSSFTVGSGVIRNGIQASYDQALGNRTRLKLTGGYQHKDYFAADEGIATDRQEDYLAFSALLAYDINAHWSAELFYSYANNDSNDPALGFDNQRVGMGLNWTY